MKYVFIFIFLIPLGLLRAQNNLVQISGELHDQKTGEALVGAIMFEMLTLGNTISSNEPDIRNLEIIRPDHQCFILFQLHLRFQI